MASSLSTFRLCLVSWQHVCSVWGCCVYWGRRQNGEQVEKHLPLWWGPWSGSRSAKACVGCTVMSWQWSAETAAQPRPPRARHRTLARRPSASRIRGERTRLSLTWNTAHDKSVRSGSMDLFRIREILISWWLNQSLASKLRCTVWICFFSCYGHSGHEYLMISLLTYYALIRDFVENGLQQELWLYSAGGKTMKICIKIYTYEIKSRIWIKNKTK